MHNKHVVFILLVLSVIVISLGACNVSNDFSVDVFDGSPADSDGVGCFFSEEGTPEKQLFASGLDNCAYISINHKLCKFEQDTTTKTEVSKNSADISDVFRNKDYTLILDLKEAENIDTQVGYKGTMTVQDNKTGKKVVKKVSGGCGC